MQPISELIDGGSIRQPAFWQCNVSGKCLYMSQPDKKILSTSAEVSTDSPVASASDVSSIRDFLFKDVELVNGLPQISMSELIKRTKELGFSSSTNQGI